MIFSDEQGRNLTLLIKTLLGDQYQVQGFCKPCAITSEIVRNIHTFTENFTEKDYVVVLGGQNDKNPYQMISYLNHLMYQMISTNVILCGTYSNRYLHKDKLNYEIKFLTSKFREATYLDYGPWVPRKYLAKCVFGRIVKVIFRISYQVEYTQYVKEMEERQMHAKNHRVKNQYTQTDDLDVNETETTQKLQSNLEEPNQNNEVTPQNDVLESNETDEGTPQINSPQSNKTFR